MPQRHHTAPTSLPINDAQHAQHALHGRGWWWWGRCVCVCVGGGGSCLNAPCHVDKCAAAAGHDQLHAPAQHHSSGRLRLATRPPGLRDEPPRQLLSHQGPKVLCVACVVLANDEGLEDVAQGEYDWHVWAGRHHKPERLQGGGVRRMWATRGYGSAVMQGSSSLQDLGNSRPECQGSSPRRCEIPTSTTA